MPIGQTNSASEHQGKHHSAKARTYDALVVGAGFAGWYVLHKLREAGFTAHAFEAEEGAGGTWFWNRYPVARCDLDSVEYQLGFPEVLQREWTWTERYATQPEIERYLNYVADRLDLRRDISFSQRVISAQYDAASSMWTVKTDRKLSVTARYLRDGDRRLVDLSASGNNWHGGVSRRDLSHCLVGDGSGDDSSLGYRTTRACDLYRPYKQITDLAHRLETPSRLPVRQQPCYGRFVHYDRQQTVL